MLKISQRTANNEGDEAICLFLEGQITGAWVEELRRVCADTQGDPEHGTRDLVLDLAGISFLDADGIALFRELAARQVSFTNSSAFIAEQLKEVADVDR